MTFSFFNFYLNNIYLFIYLFYIPFSFSPSSPSIPTPFLSNFFPIHSSSFPIQKGASLLWACTKHGTLSWDRTKLLLLWLKWGEEIQLREQVPKSQLRSRKTSCSHLLEALLRNQATKLWHTCWRPRSVPCRLHNKMLFQCPVTQFCYLCGLSHHKSPGSYNPPLIFQQVPAQYLRWQSFEVGSKPSAIVLGFSAALIVHHIQRVWFYPMLFQSQSSWPWWAPNGSAPLSPWVGAPLVVLTSLLMFSLVLLLIPTLGAKSGAPVWISIHRQMKVLHVLALW